jgi:hypothetical protein
VGRFQVVRYLPIGVHEESHPSVAGSSNSAEHVARHRRIIREKERLTSLLEFVEGNYGLRVEPADRPIVQQHRPPEAARVCAVAQIPETVSSNRIRRQRHLERAVRGRQRHIGSTPDRDNYLVVVADCARAPGASPHGLAGRYPGEIGEESLPMLRRSAVGDQTSLIRCARCWARDLRCYEPATRTLRMPGSRSERPSRNGALPGTTRTPEPAGRRTAPW